MTYTYVIFWVPTTVTQRDFVAFFPSIKRNISDNKHPHFVTLHLDEKNREIEIISELYGKNAKLEFVNDNKLGFLQYRINETDTSKELLKEIPNAIYHLVKEFYHSHKHHHSEEDSLLSALCSRNKIDLEHNGNQAIIHYLNIYEHKFKRYTRIISDEFVSIESASENRPSYKYKVLKAYNILLKQASKALGEKIYCNTLLSSKPPEFDDFNIRNSVDDIIVLKSKIENQINYRINLNSIMLSLIGVILSIIGISLAIKTTIPSRNEKEILLRTNEISDEIINNSKLDNSIKSQLDRRFDTIDFNISRLNRTQDSIIHIEETKSRIKTQ